MSEPLYDPGLIDTENQWGYNYWNANYWTLCDPSELKFTGPKSQADKPETIVDVDGETLEDLARRVWIGIQPRVPTQAEFLNTVKHFKALANRCWWVTDDLGKGMYNCYGFTVFEEEGTLRVLAPSPTVEGFYDARDFKLIKKKGKKIPSAAVVAYFGESHVAMKSHYKHKGTVLWESKLGSYGTKFETMRILHYLHDLDGGLYGDATEFYRRK